MVIIDEVGARVLRRRCFEEGGDNGSCQEQWRTKLEGWFLVLVKMQRMFWKKRKIWRFR